MSKHGQKWLIYLVQNVSMLRYIMSFIVVVIAFGLFYALLTPMGHGIGQNLKPLSEGISWVTFFKGIYFSVVTISSLGYGHMHPMGFSKALACLEVLLGLAVIGIMIAKVTSQRLSHHVSRLFSSDAQKRLEDIAAKFDTYKLNLHEFMPKLMAAYQSAPRQSSPPTEIRSTLISGFREVMSAIKSESNRLHDYLARETEQNDYFQIVAVDAVIKVGNAVESAFLILGQLITSVPSQSRFEIFEESNRQMVFEALNSQKKACNLVQKHTDDKDIRDVFHRIRETCEALPTNYFAVPVEPKESQEPPPDQVLKGTDEPKELSGADNQQTDSP
jgi:hypothetical protein